MTIMKKIIITIFCLILSLFLIFIGYRLVTKKCTLKLIEQDIKYAENYSNFSGTLLKIINRNSFQSFTVLANNDLIGEFVLNSSTNDINYKRLIGVWDSQSNYSLKYTLDGHLKDIILIVVLNENHLLTYDQNSIKIWNFHNKNLEKTLYSKSISLVISLENNLIALGHSNGLIQVWNYNNGLFLQNITDHTTNVRFLLVLKNQILVSSDESGSIKVRKLINNLFEMKFTLKGHKKVVTSIVNLNDLLASSSLDKTVKIWSLNDGSLVSNLTGHGAEIIKLVISKDNLLISGDLSGLIKIWDFKNKQFYFKYNLNGHERNIRDMVILRNGDLATGDVSGLIKIWDLKNGSLKFQLNYNHSSFLDRIKLLPLGNGGLASSSDDNTIRIWN